MIHFFKIPFSFDPTGMKADAGQLRPEDWTAHFNKDYYEGDWSGVALYSRGGAAGKISFDPGSRLPFEPAPVLARCPNIRTVLSAFKCSFCTVRLLRLKAGSVIREHRDYDLGYELGEIRIHVPVATNPDMEFYLAGSRVVMGEGECWYLDLSQPHRLHNRGKTDRIHLVIDCVVNDWLRSIIPFEILKQAGAVAALPPAERCGGLAEFREHVLAEPAMQEKLRVTSDRQLFIELTAKLGRELGYDFTEAEVSDAMRAGMRSWHERWFT